MPMTQKRLIAEPKRKGSKRRTVPTSAATICSTALRIGYADPPYYGLAQLYAAKHPEALEYNKLETHKALIERMTAEFDGWALSLHEPSLRHILPLCPVDVRVMVWVKPWVSFKPGNKQAHWAYEPVIVKLAREFTERLHGVRDYVITPMVLGDKTKRFGKGRKPEGFCMWLFEVLNLRPVDEFVDLFPGSGGVGKAWERWKQQGNLFVQ